MAVKEQYAGSAAFGLEGSFAEVLPPTTAGLLRLVSMEVETEHHLPTIRTDVWRDQGERTIGAHSYAGTMEMELDTVRDVQRDLVSCLLENRGVTPDVGFDRERFEVPRAGLPKTGKLLFAFDGGPWVTYKGVVVERIRWTFRTGQPGRMTVGWKAAHRISQGGDPGWSIALQIQTLRIKPKDVIVELDGTADGQIFEASFEIQDPKVMTQYGRSKQPSRRARDGNAALTGTLIQYYHTGAADLANVQRTNGTVDLFISALDELSGYGINLTAPKVHIESGEPIPIGVGDVMMNASFRADLSGSGASSSYIELLVQP
jgi:hypothetical protein